LKKKYRLHKTQYIGTIEQLGIFLYTVITDLSIRKLTERFQRSTKIINRYHKIIFYFLKPGLHESTV
jgi:hypothetical protein